jgi:DNA-binding GntR family transcriptional regulator
VLEKLPRTSAEEIRGQLAERIIRGDLVPGSVLDESQLACEFSVSRTPVREALKQLAASGLVQQKAHSRTIVAKPDTAALTGMFELMAHLEALCAELCAERMTPGERRALDDLHSEMSTVVSAGDRFAYIRYNELFHNAIYQGAHNGYLEDVTRQTRQRLQPLRRAQFSTLGRLARSHAEHGQVVEAILRGSRSEAGEFMRAHITLVEDAWNDLAGG